MGDYRWDVNIGLHWMLRIRYAYYHGNRKINNNNQMEHFPMNNDKCVAYVNTENKRLKEHIPQK